MLASFKNFDHAAFQMSAFPYIFNIVKLDFSFNIKILVNSRNLKLFYLDVRLIKCSASKMVAK